MSTPTSVRSILIRITAVAAFIAATHGLALPIARAADLNPTATLLISLDTTAEQKKFLIGGLYKNYSQKIEKKFRTILGNTGLDLRVIDQANLHDLDLELRNPKNVALFWISHASDPRQILKAPTGALEPVIIDQHGSDIKRIFAHPHPNLRWLSVIACSSGLILDEKGQVIEDEPETTLKKGESIELPDVAPGIPPLLVQRFTSKKGAILGMAQAAREARTYFKSVPEVRAGFQLDACDGGEPQITLESKRIRSSMLENPALALLWNHQRIGTLSPLTAGTESHTFESDVLLSLLQTALNSENSTFIEASTLFAGARKYARDFDLGDLQITIRIRRPAPYARDLDIPLQRVEKRPGVALGNATHLFELKLTEAMREELADSLEFVSLPERNQPCPAVGRFGQ